MNVYEPYLMTIDDVIDETADTRTLRLKFQDESVAESFDFRAGQFGEYSAFGAGECTFCIASPPTRRGYLECTFKSAGKVTSALRDLNPGDTVGFRGPYGNHFPLNEMEGKDLVFIAGGIGLAPVRCVIWNVLDQRDKYGKVTIVYGARNSGLCLYKADIESWYDRSDMVIHQAIDVPEEGWDHHVGYVPDVVKKVAPAPKNTSAIVCGPPIMTKFTLPILSELGFPPEEIYTSLEKRMKCGVGKCGRCNIGSKYVCKDGPVFTLAELQELPQDI